MLIVCIKPNISHAVALAKLRTSAKQLRRGRLSTTLEFYIPYRLFQITIRNGRHSAGRFVAIDSVTGLLDLYSFDTPPLATERETIESDLLARVHISEERALEIIEEKMKRETYLRGFFKVKELEVTGRFLETFYLPYYAGLYRRDERVQIEVLSLLRGQFEGAKVREIITEWFLSPTEVDKEEME